MKRAACRSVLLLSLLTCSSAYVEYKSEVTNDEGRRFGWVITWLSEQGAFGQVLANLVVALFVLPPLGPIICSLLENCDALQSRALGRSFISSYPLSTKGVGLHDDISHILQKLVTAYNDFT